MRKIFNLILLLFVAGAMWCVNSAYSGCNSANGKRTDIEATVKAQVKDADGNWVDTEYAPKGVEVKWICTAGSTDANEPLPFINHCHLSTTNGVMELQALPVKARSHIHQPEKNLLNVK